MSCVKIIAVSRSSEKMYIVASVLRIRTHVHLSRLLYRMSCPPKLTYTVVVNSIRVVDCVTITEFKSDY